MGQHPCLRQNHVITLTKMDKKSIAKMRDTNITIQIIQYFTPDMDGVTHFEIPYKDKDAMQKFYEDVFGWKITKLPDMDYHWATTTESDSETWMPKKIGVINGGMREKHAPEDGLVIVMSVKSIDDSLKKVEELGGRIVFPKFEVGKHGLYAQIADVEGNVLGLWQANSDKS